MVEGTCLENRHGATHRGFESHPLRHLNKRHFRIAGTFSAQVKRLMGPHLPTDNRYHSFIRCPKWFPMTVVLAIVKRPRC